MEREELRKAAQQRPPEARHEPTIWELEQLLRIDTLDLMSESASQPELFYRIAKLLAGFRAEEAAMKLVLDEAKARAAIRARQAADETGTKITVGEMEAIVRLDPDVVAANARMQAVGQKLGDVTALKEAYSQRKSSLSDLVELQRQAGAPIDPAVVRQAVNERRNRQHWRHGHGE